MKYAYPIPLHRINGRCLQKVVEFLQYYDEMIKENSPLSPVWLREYFNVNLEILAELDYVWREEGREERKEREE